LVVRLPGVESSSGSLEDRELRNIDSGHRESAAINGWVNPKLLELNVEEVALIYLRSNGPGVLAFKWVPGVK
jgi:hypothetical protein